MNQIKRVISILLVFSLLFAFVACGNVSKTKKIEEVLPGTYVGENGSVLIIKDDGTAYYYYTSYPDMDQHNTWTYEDGTLKMNISSCLSSVIATVSVDDVSTFVLAADGTASELFWDDERYTRASDNTEIMSKNDCDSLIAELLGEEFLNQITYETVSPYGVDMTIPSGYEQTQSTSSITYTYDEDAIISISLETVGSVSNAYFRSTVRDNLDSLFPSGFGVDEIVSTEEVSVGNYIGYKCEITGTYQRKNYSGYMLLVNYNSSSSGKLFLMYIFDFTQDKRYFNEYDNITSLLDQYTVAGGASSSSSSGSSSSSSSTSTSSDGVDPDLKAALDEYEEFMNSYVEFMQTYMNSDYTQMMNMMNEYMQMLEDYEEAMNAIESMDTSSMSTADLAYYMEVTTRVTNNLLSVYGT